jgi:hypothetical protein
MSGPRTFLRGTRRLLPGTTAGLLFLGLYFTTTGASAQPPMVVESEPNNLPQEAMLVSGAVTLAGTMAGDDQDAFLWTVSDDDARKRWTFELQGIPGRLTILEIVRLDYTDDGAGVVHIEKLMKMGTRDGLKPSVHEDLMFEPGEYLLGMAAAGGGEGGIFRPPAATLWVANYYFLFKYRRIDRASTNAGHVLTNHLQTHDC